jgi:hypothetical protein
MSKSEMPTFSEASVLLFKAAATDSSHSRGAALWLSRQMTEYTRSEDSHGSSWIKT